MSDSSQNLQCPENFHEMENGPLGRHCNRCNTPVVDVTTKSWEEIYLLRLKHGDHFCGGYTKQQFEEMVRFRRPISYDLKKGFIMTSIFLALGAQARVSNMNQPLDLLDYCHPDIAEIKPMKTTFVGRIYNPLGDPAIGVKVILKNTPELHTFSNDNGEFRLEIPMASKDLIGNSLLFEGEYYEPKEIELTKSSVKQVQFIVKLDYGDLGIESFEDIPEKLLDYGGVMILEDHSCEMEKVKLSGVVSSPTYGLLKDAQISIIGTDISTKTDSAGRYEMEIPDELLAQDSLQIKASYGWHYDQFLSLKNEEKSQSLDIIFDDEHVIWLGITIPESEWEEHKKGSSEEEEE